MTTDCLLVVDLECTCSDESTPVAEQITPETMEIIEVGAVIANLRGEVLDRFGRFVRPTERPALTEFCSKLTSIQQADVDISRSLRDHRAKEARNDARDRTSVEATSNLTGCDFL